jgi:tRNA 5-methylaminomethyl-2-thiouridine biosynthesis bifunctional protein
LPRLPLARNGYVIPLPDGGVLCGATQAAGDDDPALRASDHGHNLAVLRRLAGLSLAAPDAGTLGGRVGWRCHADDRLPLVGALPLDDERAAGAAAAGARLAQPRHVPRASGLFVLAALGSRGLTSAALGAQVLAAWVCDTPMPVDTDLLDAVDAARYRARAARRGAGAR